MASRNRLKQDVLRTLTQQFKDWGLPRDIDYKSYCGIVDAPVVPRAIQKSYYNWKTAVHAVHLNNPAGFEQAPPPPPPPPKPAPKKAAVKEEEKNDE